MADVRCGVRRSGAWRLRGKRWHRTGRAERDLDADPVNVNDVVVGVRASARSDAEVLQDIRKQVGMVPASFFVTAPLYLP